MRLLPIAGLSGVLLMVTLPAYAASIYIEQVARPVTAADNQPQPVLRNQQSTPRDAIYSRQKRTMDGELFLDDTNLRATQLENDAANNPMQLSAEQAGTLQFIGNQRNGSITAAREATAAIDPLTGAINLGLPNGQTVTIPTQ